MSRITKIYLKLFLFYGLIFGVINLLWYYIDKGEINVLKIIFLIIFFGGFMSWSSVKSIKKSMKKFKGEKLTDDDFEVSQSQVISKSQSIKQVYDLLKSDELTKNWKLNFKESKIVGRTKITWTSWGERITVSELNDKLKIESKPFLGIVPFDNGANKGNVNLIKVLIEG